MELSSFLSKNESNPEIRQLVELIAGESLKIKKAFLRGSGFSGAVNIYGEKTLKLDQYANKVLVKVCKESGLVSEVGSEEEGGVIKFAESKGSLGVTFDPLDGSSNVPTNLTVGTIVGVYKGKSVLSGGRNQAAAFYILYGPLTILVYAGARGVSQFVLNEKGRFILSKAKLQIPEGNIMAPGGLRSDYLPNHEKFIQHLEDEDYKIRYSGSLVADVHQVLHYGGVFTYPALKTKPEGKLRLIFEANPLGFIIEKAGGYCSNRTGAILDIKPTGISHRTPLYIGSKDVVKTAEKFMKGG